MSAPRQNTDNRSRPQGQPPISEQGIPNTVNNGQMDKQKLYTKQAHIHTAPPLHIRNKHYSKNIITSKLGVSMLFINTFVFNSKQNNYKFKSPEIYTLCPKKQQDFFEIPCSSLRLTN